MSRTPKVASPKVARTAPVDWETLLQRAVEQPGLLSKAYFAFHNYSFGNRIAAVFQCELREMPVGPIDTFKGWEAKGRRVRKGEKALWLCMPYTRKVEDEKSGETKQVISRFDWKPLWFTLHQTEGEDAAAIEIPSLEWDASKALAELGIMEIPFTHPNGNAQGFARERSIAVSPLAVFPHKTRFHEIAHVVLGHTGEGELSDVEGMTKNLIEVEAESVAYLLCHSLDLPGVEYSRGYIQHWQQSETIPETNARRIFSAADKILKAGKES